MGLAGRLGAQAASAMDEAIKKLIMRVDSVCHFDFVRNL
jgi:hypothetical protein